MKKYIFPLLLSFCSFTQTNAQQVKHVVVISIDGFRPDFYREDQWSTYNMKYLAKKGVSADYVRSIFPSVTYPSHTTLTTGVLPEKHGIYYNTTLGENGENGGWIYDFKSITAPTIWEAAKKKGLTTASVSWPITVNNPFIDYNIPEIWSFKNMGDRRDATSEYAHPKGLFEEVVAKATGEMEMDDFNLNSFKMDQNLGRIAGYILKTYKPNLLTLHLPITDGAEHKEGRDGELVKKAIAGADHVIGSLYETLEKAKMLDNTAIIITGDHGFVTTHTAIAPNLWLKEIGVADKAFFFSTGGSAFLHLKDKKDVKTLDKIKDKLKNLPLSQRDLFRVISKEQMQLYQTDPNASLALTAEEGYAFNNNKDGKLFTPSLGGKHGYFPDFPHIYTGFIGYGAGFKKEMKVQQIEMENIAGIISGLLELDFLPEAKEKTNSLLKK